MLVAGYAVFTTPTGTEVVEIETGGWMMICSACVAKLPPESVALTVKLTVVADVGNPLIRPFDARLSPVPVSEPAAKVHV